MHSGGESPLFINIWDYHNRKFPFNIFIGGRGTGKTYSGLEGAVDSKNEFIYMRRMKSDLEELTDAGGGENGNPFQELNRNRGWNYGIQMITDKRGGIYHREVGEDGVYTAVGAPIGHALPLTTIAKMRGLSMPKVRYWLYDEFIKEAHVPKIKGEADALFNAYETICRNREFKGEDPIYMDLCSNATDIYNEIFKGLAIVSDVEKMIAQKKQHRYFESRGLAVHLLESTESFKKKKENTAIMRLTRGTRYASMAIGNTFAYNDFSLVEYRSIKGYNIIAHVSDENLLIDAYIYKAKDARKYYVSYAPAKCRSYVVSREQDALRFRREIGITLQNPYMYGALIFESYELKEFILDNIL